MKYANDASGTGLTGYVTTTYDELVQLYGEPNGCGPDDPSGGKVTCEWVLRFGNDVVAIYDWKVGKTPRDSYDWHIGSRKAAACSHITGSRPAH